MLRTCACWYIARDHLDTLVLITLSVTTFSEVVISLSAEIPALVYRKTEINWTFRRRVRIQLGSCMHCEKLQKCVHACRPMP